jgi:hypothetical protein
VVDFLKITFNRYSMGYVFTPEEFEKGKIPTIPDYKEAMRQLRSGLRHLYEQGAIYGANIHGSNINGDASIGSDIDALVITNLHRANYELSLLKNNIRGYTKVPIEFVPIPKNIAEKGNHLLDFFYVKYIEKYCSDGIVGKNPIPILSELESWKNPVEEMRTRLKSNLVKLAKTAAMSSNYWDETSCKLLEKLMRQPIYSTIDVLRAKHGYAFPEKDGKPLSKRECCELYKSEFPRSDTSDLFMVLDMRKSYSEFIATRKGTVEEYENLLGEIDSIFPNAWNVIEQNLNLLGKK